MTDSPMVWNLQRTEALEAVRADRVATQEPLAFRVRVSFPGSDLGAIERSGLLTRPALETVVEDAEWFGAGARVDLLLSQVPSAVQASWLSGVEVRLREHGATLRIRPLAPSSH